MSVEARYHSGSTVFGQWEIREPVRIDAQNHCAYFRLVRKDNPGIQSALKVITMLMEAGHPSQIPEKQLREFEYRKSLCRESAARSLRQMQNLQASPHILRCYGHAFQDWQDQSGFGCDVLVHTDLFQDLRSRLQQSHGFAEQDVLKVGMDVGAALNLCHNNQVIHRNICPENIFCGADGYWKLGDTVLADLQNVLAAPQVISPGYRAPEQFQFNHYRESDIYSLGLVLYEMSNGAALPFAATSQSPRDALNARLSGYALPQPSQASPALTAVLNKACAFHPGERYRSSGELLAGLNQAYQFFVNTHRNVPVSNTPPVPPRAEPEKPRESGSSTILVVRTIVITALVFLVLGAGIFFYLHLISNPSGTLNPQVQATQPTAGPSVPQGTTPKPAETTEATEPTKRTLPTSHYYYSCYNPYTEFVLPNSDTHYYAPGELKNLSDKQLEVALAEIDARHGRTPSDPLLAEYFSYLSWFRPSGAPYTLSTLEEANALLIRTLQKQRNGTLNQHSNPYMPYFQPNSFFMPETATRYLTSTDLKDLSSSELNLALNEIFARHGYIFEATELMEYFYSTNWYVPTYTREQFTYNYFSREETENIDLIRVYQDLLDYTGPRSNNPYIQYLTYPAYILPDSDTVRLQESDLEGLDDNQLLLAESEIYARHGLAFEDASLMHYFLECHWYTPEFGPNRTSRIHLSSVEQANLELIKAYRRNR